MVLFLFILDNIEENLLQEITILLETNINFKDYLSKMKLSLKLFNLQNGYDLFFK